MRQRAVAPTTMVVESLYFTSSLGLLQWVQFSVLAIADDATGGAVHRFVALIKLPKPPELVIVNALQTSISDKASQTPNSVTDPRSLGPTETAQQVDLIGREVV